jgi:HD-GYP domain-containing protein (c-di-GMP phosphodiesterase class II)
MDVDEAFRLIDRIDEVMAKKIQFASISPDVFRTLDDANASRREIELIEPKINESVNLRLKAIASSVYIGTLRRGDISSFYDVVNCLGTNRTKALLFILSNYCQGIMDEEVETIFARSYATAVMAEILASQTGFREDGIRKAELCALFLEVGRRFMVIYKKLYPGDAEKLDEDFIETYHPYLGDKIVERYSLPDYVRTVILARNLILEENHVSLAGLVYLAHDTVRASFRKNDNKLVIKCQVPRPATDVTRTLEAVVTEKFKVVGLEKYLHIIRIPRIHDL